MDDDSYFDSAFLPDGQDAAQEDAYYEFSQGSKQVSDGDGSNDKDSTSESDSSSESKSEGESDRSIEEKGPKRRNNLSRERRGRDPDEEVEEDTRAKRSKPDQPSISAMNLFVFHTYNNNYNNIAHQNSYDGSNVSAPPPPPPLPPQNNTQHNGYAGSEENDDGVGGGIPGPYQFPSSPTAAPNDSRTQFHVDSSKPLKKRVSGE